MKTKMNNDDQMRLSLTLKQLLRERDISIAQLSRATTVPRQTIDNWLSGQEPRSLRQVKLVARYFDISVDKLCFNDSPSKEPIEELKDEINAGVFEVVLRRITR